MGKLISLLLCNIWNRCIEPLMCGLLSIWSHIYYIMINWLSGMQLCLFYIFFFSFQNQNKCREFLIFVECDIWLCRFLNVIKQFLCLSLLKNSALSVMSIFQLLCSIFQSLLSKYRSVLKSEIGIFFPMLILRVLENVLQPSFIQKMTILNLLDKISQDSQIMVDIFVNYDCDVDSPNIFER